MVADLRISITDIPQLDAPPVYTPLESSGPHPMVRLPSGHEAVHLTRYRDVHKALTDPAFSRALANADDGPSFFPTPLPPAILPSLDLPDHGRVRSPISRHFAATAVESMQPLIHKTVNELLDDLASTTKPADLVTKLAMPLPARVICELLGVPPEDSAHFESRSMDIQIMDHGNVDAVVHSFGALWSYLTTLVTGERPSHSDGLVQNLLATRRNGVQLTDEELVGLLLVVVVAGDQTVVSALVKALYLLLSEPRLWRRLVQRPDCIPSVLEECFRLIPVDSIAIVPRVATRDVTLPSGTVHAGQAVFPDAFAANRDPEFFPEPTIIDSDRAGARHLGFGHGLHHCLGAALARMQLPIALDALVARFPGLTLATDPDELDWIHGVILRRPKALPVAW